MSAFMADLGYTSLNACTTIPRRIQLCESMRRLARLPHALTWMEYDKQAHRKRVKEAYHPEVDANPESVPDRSGWLLMQHPKIETAFMALHCTSHSWKDDQRVTSANSGAFAYSWTCDDGVSPWPRDPFYHQDHAAHINHTDKIRICSPEGILTGVLEYRTPCVSVNAAPHFNRVANEQLQLLAIKRFHPLGELAHDARYLWSLLATINDLPTSLVSVRPDHGYFSRGKYRKFSEHTVISLTVPAKRYIITAKRAIAVARRRGHQVRGHWRKNRFHPGERVWIREHVRGDTSLGFVLHDYTVEHPTEDQQ